MTLIDIQPLIARIPAEINRIPFKDLALPLDFKRQYEIFLTTDNPDGYREIFWDKYTAKIITKKNLIIFFPNYWFYIASKLAVLVTDLTEHHTVFTTIFSHESQDKRDKIADSLRKSGADHTLYRSQIDTFFASSTRSLNEKAAFLKVVTDYASWGGGKTISRPNDFYNSPLLKAATLLAESQTAIAELAIQLSKKSALLDSLNDFFSAISTGCLAEPTQPLRLPSSSLSIPKSFVLLAGISGTGKSRFVREQASCTIGSDNFLLIPVRPDWHEPSDLLGYVSRIGGSPTYVATPFLGFIVKAWKAAFESFVGNDLVLRPLDEIPTFWVCLDEMNLAPVEQYFADYLSVIETRKWEKDKYSCDALIKPFELLKGDASALDELKKLLELDGCDQLWSYFETFGVPLPPNLIVAGTVNMDETTHGFSRKVIDRALTIDFGNFFPNDFEKYFGQQNKPKALSFARYSKATPEQLILLVFADPDGTKSTAFLSEVNGVLRGTPFELAYRAQNELLVSLLCFKPKDDSELLAVWDDFLMCKLLPRLEGDEEKFRKSDGTNVLDTLLDLIKLRFPSDQTGSNRIDLLSATWDDKDIYIDFRSPAKLKWMKDRLSGGFTSFWP